MYKWKITVEYQRDTSVPETSRKTEKFSGNLKMQSLFIFKKKKKKVKSCLHELMVLKELKQIFCLMLCVECDDKILKFKKKKKSFYIHFCKSEKFK